MKKNLDTLDENDSLKEEEVFGKERIIKLDPDIIEKLDHGMQVKYETTELEKNIPYFVKNTDFISNVIEFDGQYIIPLRKIGAFL
jgi:cell division septal protein FtsQ